MCFNSKGNNKIVSLPKEFFALENLTQLFLYGNGIMMVQEEIVQLKNLCTLALSNNCLMEVPMQLKKLTKLTSLTLYDNPCLNKEELEELGTLLNMDLCN